MRTVIHASHTLIQIHTRKPHAYTYSHLFTTVPWTHSHPTTVTHTHTFTQTHTFTCIHPMLKHPDAFTHSHTYPPANCSWRLSHMLTHLSWSTHSHQSNSDLICLICCCLVTKSWPTLCNPMDYRPQGPSLHGIFQARIMEWVAISYSSGSSQPRDQTGISCIGR